MQGFPGKEDRPHAGETKPDFAPGHGHRIAPSLVEMAPRNSNQYTENRLEGSQLLLLEQVLRLELCLAKQCRGKITASSLEIASHIFQDIRELQSLPEPDADFRHLMFIPTSQRREVRAHHLGPKFPDTTGDIVDVRVEIRHGLERSDFVR